MRFTIVTVTKNNLKGLKRTHKSLGAQTCRDYEWIVVDGASKDGTQAYLAATNAIWASAPDKSLYHAMNKAIPEAAGDYILFLNAGDMLAGPWVLDRLSKAVNGAKRMPDFIYGDAFETRTGAPPFLKKARSHKKYRYGMFTHHQAMLYKRARLKKLRYNPRYRIAADYDFTCRFFRLKKIRALYVPMELCLFQAGGLSQRFAERGRAEQADIRKRLNLCGPLANAFIRWRQKLGWLLRGQYPALYHAGKGGLTAARPSSAARSSGNKAHGRKPALNRPARPAGPLSKRNTVKTRQAA
jgi:putative colanic acid biosynthesis glycosyltransferase